jgi:ubiquinone/menaquinone biosynthesis C-methylase UbiE
VKQVQEKNETLQFYEEEARRYREIHARPLLRYSAALEHEFIEPFLPTVGPSLDIGCGEGRTTRYLAERVTGAVIGADFSASMVGQANLAADSPSLSYCVADACRLPFKDGSFRVVTAMTTFNNVPDLRSALSEVSRVLLPGGILVATVINRSEAARFARAVYFAPYFLYRFLTHGRSRMIRRNYRRDEVLSDLPASMEVLSCEGMRMIPDFLPEYPFNFWPSLQALTYRVYAFLRPLDIKLCRHPVTGKYARFHLLIARKR